MVDLNIVREQYERMQDEELVRFARAESHNLTIQSFHLLKLEFEARNLDLNVIEDARVTRELQEATKLSEFERVTASAFAENIWEFAFDEKEAGKSNEQIFNELLKKNITADYAYMLIESIEPRSRQLADSFDTEIIIGWILLVIGIFLSMYIVDSKTVNIFFIVWGPLLALGGIIRLSGSYSKRKKYQTIVDKIEAEKNQSNLYQ